MQKRTNFRMRLATVVVMASLASSAHAIDVTGTWAGTKKCLNYASGTSTTKFESAVTVRLTQIGSQVNGEVDGLAFSGIVLDDSAKPEVGVVTLVHCGTAANSEGIPTEHFVMNVKANSEKGKIKGSYVTAWVEFGINGRCTFKLDRTETTNPNISACN